MIEVLFVFYSVVNLITLLLFAIDKYNSIHGRWRISEYRLLLFAFAGGAVGALCAMRLFRHKTLHNKFTLGVPFALLLHLVAIAYFLVNW